MNLKLHGFISKVSDEELRDALMVYMRRIYKDFSKMPASRRFHHAYSGGLLDHTIEVCEIALKMNDSLCLGLDIDHLIAAAVLHDAGKYNLYEYDKVMHRWTHADVGRRMDHSLVPVIDFHIVTGVSLPKEVQYGVLSHMGGWSDTSMFPDDVLSTVIHSADLLSSRLSPGKLRRKV